MNNLPFEILELIFVYLNYNTIIKVCKQWKKIAEKIKYKFKLLNINLLNVKPQDIQNFNPEILNIFCFQNSNSNNLVIISNFDNSLEQCVLNKEHCVHKKVINLIELLDIFQKYTNLKILNVHLDFIYNSKDTRILTFANRYHNYFNWKFDKTEKFDDLNKNTLCAKIMITLMQVKVKHFNIKINNYCVKKKNFLYYEHYMRRFLMNFSYFFDKCTFSASDGHYFYYNKSLKTLKYQIGNYQKHKIYTDDNNIECQKNQNKFCDFFDDDKFYILDPFFLDNLNYNGFKIHNLTIKL